MEAGGAAPSAVSIHPETSVGAVRLAVADLARTAAFYERAIGFAVMDRSPELVRLGVGDGHPLLDLAARPGSVGGRARRRRGGAGNATGDTHRPRTPPGRRPRRSRGLLSPPAGIRGHRARLPRRPVPRRGGISPPPRREHLGGCRCPAAPARRTRLALVRGRAPRQAGAGGSRTAP